MGSNFGFGLVFQFKFLKKIDFKIGSKIKPNFDSLFMN